MINSHPFHSMSISPPIPQIRLFQTLTLKLQGQGHVWGQRSSHPVSNRCTSFSFHINRTNHSWEMSNRVFDLQKTHPKIAKKIWQKKRVSNRIPPKSNQVINMTREIWLLSFVWIGWMVLTLSCRQANFCLSMSQPLPWVKVTTRSSNTFFQTYTFFVPNI